MSHLLYRRLVSLFESRDWDSLRQEIDTARNTESGLYPIDQLGKLIADRSDFEALDFLIRTIGQEYHLTLMIYAADKGYVDVFDFLLEHPMCPKQLCLLVLIKASLRENITIIERALTHDINFTCSLHNTDLLDIICRKDDVKVFDYLLVGGFPISNYLDYIFYKTLKAPHCELLNRILSLGINPNDLCLRAEEFPLLFAVEQWFYGLPSGRQKAKILVDHGADLTPDDFDRILCLCLRRESGKYDYRFASEVITVIRGPHMETRLRKLREKVNSLDLSH